MHRVPLTTHSPACYDTLAQHVRATVKCMISMLDTDTVSGPLPNDASAECSSSSTCHRSAVGWHNRFLGTHVAQNSYVTNVTVRFSINNTL
jgi:hypothetical protein